jgi:hypothetical protein
MGPQILTLSLAQGKLKLRHASTFILTFIFSEGIHSLSELLEAVCDSLQIMMNTGAASPQLPEQKGMG